MAGGPRAKKQPKEGQQRARRAGRRGVVLPATGCKHRPPNNKWGRARGKYEGGALAVTPPLRVSGSTFLS